MFSFFKDETTTTETSPTTSSQVQGDAHVKVELKLVDDLPVVTATESWNDKGLQTGYNPYQSGLLAGKKPVAKKTDMRELSKWIEMKRRMDGQAPIAKKSSQGR
jgi:hypothetical protein